MSARIIIQSGISAGTEHWIERSVIRVGSDPNADVVIPSSELAAHALTIEYRQPNYRVYNRGQEPVVLGGQLLSPNRYGIWSDSDLLELPDGVSLALELDANPKPTVKPSFRLDPEPIPALGNDISAARSAARSAATDKVTMPGSGSSSGKIALQIAVTLACLFGCAWLLWRHQTRDLADRGQPAPQFDFVVRQALEADSRISRELVQQLQVAEASFVCGQRPMARKRYRSLYDSLRFRLNARRNTENIESQDLEQKMERLIEHRLEQLTR
jgi:hypothetical protein